MRATRFLFIAAGASLSASLLAFACGGTTETATDGGSVADAVADTVAPVVDAAVKDAKADVACTAAGIDTLEFPDASLDDGGINTATCVACLKANCQDEIAKCNADCDCRGAATTFVQCLQGATDFNKVVGCAGSAGFNLPQDAQDALYGVALCGNSSCNKQCVPKGLLDGSVDGATD